MGLRSTGSLGLLLLLGALGCKPSGGRAQPLTGLTAADHRWFPIGAGAVHQLGDHGAQGALACESCHAASKDTFTDFSCVSCHKHEQPTTDALHTRVPNYRYASEGCYACHPKGERMAFDHAGIAGSCAACHDVGASFAALPQANFTHPDVGGADCSSCHRPTRWSDVTGYPPSITVGGFAVPQPPATGATTQAGIPGLPHPTPGPGQTCTSCHASPGGGKGASGYDHASALASGQCNACHEAGSDLVGTPWNGATALAAGAGDTRPFTLTDLVARYNGGSLAVADPAHFYPTDCAQCHATPAGTGATATGAAYAAVWTFPHSTGSMTNPATCLLCHTGGIPGAPDGGVYDPAADVTVNALIPTYSGTSISQLSPQAEALHMTMDHASPDVPGAAFSACSNCHANAGSGSYYPGTLHGALASLILGQPTACASCHGGAAPRGFVGPTATQPPRSPASPEMKHDAVAWAGGAPTAAALVPSDCGVCHLSPAGAGSATWASGPGGARPSYHAALGGAGLAQPGSCLDCHANTRPTGVLSSPGAALPAGVQFDHAGAQGECAACHAASATGWSSWAGGQFHLPGSATPASCLPCHTSERPSSTAGWASATYRSAPFDYTAAEAGVPHGDGQDCAQCHAGPGTGAWGGTQNWQGGSFAHGAGTVAGATCVACHQTQRPDLQPGTTPAAMATLLGFDHAANGAGDCAGCHQATVRAGRYAHYANPATGALPGGDWQGGVGYPGSTYISDTRSITEQETVLNRSGPYNLVSSTSSVTATLYNGMVHTSAGVPPELNAGPTSSPDNTKCWHCHTSTGTTVTNFLGGKFHDSLNNYAATPGGAVTPLAQPTGHCSDCHGPMLPTGIVEKAGSILQPMDHAAQFTASVVLGGTPVTAVAQAECVACHTLPPGGTWTDGAFHASIGAGTPSDCVLCHYPLMASAGADVASGSSFTMKHRSGQLTTQNCALCHPGALARSTAGAPAAALWQTGALHASLAAQPTACVECHAVSEPAANASTQSSVSYALAQGGTATNAGQWMNHGQADVAGKDCAVCHQADARASGSAWSKATSFHAAVAHPASCQLCHGLGNGGGSVAGTRNNLPSGLTDTTTVTSADASTGVAGTLDQISHADVNVTGHDCNFCHTQAGPSSAPGVQGKEWAQASFHSRFNAGSPLVANGTTGRCSNCHLNVKPTAAFAAQDHSTFTSASGSQDCASCHSWPGTGTASAPNWLGASSVPTYINVGGFPVSQPPATSATTEPGIPNLPHPGVPSGTACTACHTSSAGGKPATGYDHASSLIAGACNACHEAGSDLVTPVWNNATTASAGAGDTRAYTLTSYNPSYKGNRCNFTNPNHFYSIDCSFCHATPTGIVTGNTGTTYTTMWKFKHPPEYDPPPANCYVCHNTCGM